MPRMRIGIAAPGHLKTVPMGRYCAETFRRMGHEVLLFDAGSGTGRFATVGQPHLALGIRRN